jgi:hypothetical protein
MTRSILFFSFLALAGGGCAAIDGNFMRTATETTPEAAKPVEYEAMTSLPPAALKEDRPQLAAGEAWVPGYYQPISGSWIWHQGSVTPKRDGYTLLPASYKEENGKVRFSPPKWRRNDLVSSKAK